MLLWGVLLVLAGALAVAVLLLFIGGGECVRLESNTESLKTWGNLFPEHPAGNVVLEPSGMAALVDLEDGGTGLLWATGNKIKGQVLNAGSFGQEGSVLRIELPEINKGHLDVTIDEPMVRRIWIETLKTVLKPQD